ncbi:MAG: hypothetical protein PHI31_10410 [Desulfuromonadaceae bacterium]|nr:hypothetical protein [Desulfuromonadaceae bacterium]
MIAPVSGTTQSNSAATVAPAVQVLSDSVKAQQTAKQDAVNISKTAQKLASDGDTQAQESRESGAEKATEKFRNKA